MAALTKRNITIGAIVVGIPVLLLAWWLVSPLFIDTEVSEEFPMSASAEIPDDMTQAEVEEEMADAAEAPAALEEEPMPETAAEPAVIRTGSFQDADDSHLGSGTATIYELEDGSLVLRLQDFEVTNGPDLHVLLVPAANPTSRDDVGGYVDLGSLKGNIGSQNYDIPAGTNPDDFGSVVIYCQPFHVLFSIAGLS